MSMGHSLPNETPELLDGVEPGGVGRQVNEFQAGVLRQSFQSFGVEMDRPIIDDQVDSLGLGIALSGATPALSQARRRHPVEAPCLHSTIHRIQKAYDSHQGVGTVAVAQPGLATAHARPQPSLAGLTVEAGLITKQQDYLSWTRAGFPKGLLQAPFFSTYAGSGLWT